MLDSRLRQTTIQIVQAQWRSGTHMQTKINYGLSADRNRYTVLSFDCGRGTQGWALPSRSDVAHMYESAAGNRGTGV